jgi:hypothetical protein
MLMDTRFFEEERDVFAKQQAFLDDFVLPDYDMFNVKNISGLVSKVYGIHSLGKPAFSSGYLDDFDGVEKVFLVVLYGFVYNRLLNHIKTYDGVLSEFVSKGVLKPLTSPFPATTSTSLTSIFTGLQPSEHGVIGYQMFSREYGCVFNTLEMKPVYGYNSEVEIAKDFAKKVKPWMPTLQEHGVRSYVATKSSIVGSGLSKVIHADQELVPYGLESEMLVKCRRVLEQAEPVFLVLYYSGIDALEHRYGPYSEEVTSEIQLFECALKNLLGKLSGATKKETLIILTADHGVCETRRTYYVKDYPEVARGLRLPPVGDSRCGFLFTKSGQGDNVKRAFEKGIEGFRVVPTSELIEKGAFGRTADSALLESAVGDVAALSKGSSALQYPYYEDDRKREQLGGHGGMTAEEVIVPLLSLRLSKV